MALTRLAVVAGTRHGLGVGLLVFLQRRHAGVQYQRGDADTLGYQPSDELRGEGATGAGHFRAPRLGGVDVLVGAERPCPPDIAIADGSSVGLQPIYDWRHAQ